MLHTMTAIDDIPGVVQRLREGFEAGANLDLGTRHAQLRQLRRFLSEREADIAAALHADLGKSPIEAYMTETGFTSTEIAHLDSNLDQWTRQERVRLQLTMRPGSAFVSPEPKGVVMVIGAWNYPVQLTLAPLAAALAAGNTVVVKPSEVAAATSRFLAETLPQYLDERIVTVVEGGVAETTALLQERFDHILYTGNGSVGRIVMRAAAEHLTPVTLELGGKSPAIVAADANLEATARRLTWGKFTNAGQTCVAPDYVLVHRDAEDQLLGDLLRCIHDFYGNDPHSSPDYGRIVNDRHFDRLVDLLDGEGYEAVVTGGDFKRDDHYIAPTVLAGVRPDSAVMAGEIFGPILPVIAVDDLDEAIRFVNARPKPLALYVFSEHQPTAERVVERTSSGGATINHVMMHVGVSELPFGGVGESGIGAYHGRSGFDTFSHRKSVLVKPTKPDPSIAYPPYKRWKESIIRRLL